MVKMMRSRNALAELKRLGKKLGTPENLTNSARAKAKQTIKRNALNNDRNRQAQEKSDTVYSMYFLMCNIDSKNTLFDNERMDGLSINIRKLEANQRKKIISLFESVKHK